MSDTRNLFKPLDSVEAPALWDRIDDDTATAVRSGRSPWKQFLLVAAAILITGSLAALLIVSFRSAPNQPGPATVAPPTVTTSLYPPPFFLQASGWHVTDSGDVGPDEPAFAWASTRRFEEADLSPGTPVIPVHTIEAMADDDVVIAVETTPWFDGSSGEASPGVPPGSLSLADATLRGPESEEPQGDYSVLQIDGNVLVRVYLRSGPTPSLLEKAQSQLDRLQILGASSRGGMVGSGVTYTDTLGWSVDYPSLWTRTQIATQDKVSLSGASFANVPIPDATSPGSPAPLPADGVEVAITHRAGGPAPDPSVADTRLPISVDDFTCDEVLDDAICFADIHGNGYDLSVSMRTGPDASASDIDAGKALIASLRFPSTAEGTVSSDPTQQTPATTSESDADIERQVRLINDAIMSAMSEQRPAEGDRDPVYDLMQERHAVCESLIIHPREEHSPFVEGFCSSTLRELRGD